MMLFACGVIAGFAIAYIVGWFVMRAEQRAAAKMLSEYLEREHDGTEVPVRHIRTPFWMTTGVNREH
jgi:hypothetical protein